MSRDYPNILICGTPGTGKTTLATELCSRLDHFVLYSVGQIAEQNEFYNEFDEARQTNVLDEDKLLDHIEDELATHSGGAIIEYHGLTARGYSQEKITENMDCEIFGTIVEEARESYSTDIVHELKSDTVEHMESNLDNITAWVEQWKNNH